MYVAEENQIFYCHPNEAGSRELFITIHPTKDCTKSTHEQAQAICRLLNEPTHYRTAIYLTS